MRWRTVLAVVAVCAACGDAAGPHRTHNGQLSIAPVVADDPVPVVNIAGVRIQLTHPGDTTPFIDTVVTVSPNQVEFSIEITVPITGDQETCVLSIALYDQDGVEVYRSEPIAVTIGEASDAAPVSVPIEYVGPGADAVSVEIQERDVVVYTGDETQFTAVARDAAGEVILEANIGWIALDPLVTVEDHKTGVVRAGMVAGDARVVALLPKIREGAPSIEDTATVTVHANQPPDEVSIASPHDGGQFLSEETVEFTGSAHDPEDGSLADAALSWESSIDGVLGSGTSFTRNDLSPGTHQITLTASDSRAASSTTSVAITVADLLTITTTSLPDGTVGAPYSAQLEASGGFETYVWSLSMGSLPTGLRLTGNGSVSGTPTSAGTATFTVMVVSGELSATRTLTITVSAVATTTTITSDEPDPSQIGQPVAVGFSVTSTAGAPAGNVVVSDGIDSCSGTVTDAGCTLVLTTAGIRTLTAVYAGNADFAGSSDTESHTVNQPPTADAGSDQAVTDTDLSGSEPVTLDGSGSTDVDGTIVSYTWSENGNTIATDVTPTVDLIVGVHTITLTVTDNGGATDTDQVTVTVSQGNQPPNANAGQDQTLSDADGTGAEPVTLDGSGSSDPDGTIISYAWSENGNTIAAGINPTVDLGVGVHTITLTVMDDGEATASDQVVVTVLANQLPTANAGSDQAVTDTDLSGSEPVTLDGSGSTDADGTIVSYTWSENGNTIATGVTPTVDLTVGVHTITLTVTDNGGATGTDQVAVTVSQGNQPPNANAGQDQTLSDADGTGAEAVTLDGSGSSDPDGTIISYVWSENGNTIATGVTPTVDLTVGVHTITLTVTDNGGATGTDQVTVTVSQGNQPPNANAGQDQTLSDADGTGAEPVTLDGSGSSDPDGTIISYVWSENGNTIATGMTPTVDLTVGVHTITLTVIDNGEATASDQVVVTVLANQLPTANAGSDQAVTDTDLSGSEPVTLDGSGSTDADGTIVSYTWSENGNTIATGVTPTVDLTVGVHTIILTVTDNGGATDTDAVNVTVELGLTTLTIVGSGSGDGTVTSAPAGISCTITDGVATGDCTESYQQGTNVTLSATASANGIHQFDGWGGTGESCPGVEPCAVTMDGNLTVTAFFTQYFTLTVQGSGNGTGTVAGGNGIDCAVSAGATQGTCSTLFQEGVIAGLSASAGPGSGFTGWSGACSGTGACQVDMSQPQTVTATFTLQQFVVTVQGAGGGTGTITSVPAGIDCTSYAGELGGTCSRAFDYGTPVTLNAAASQGSSFAGWEGSGISCPGTGSCSFTVTANQTVVASFDQILTTLTVLIDGLGAVASQGASPAISCSYTGGVCSAAYPWGTQVTLVASSQNPDFQWESWFGTGTGFTCTTNATCSVTMDQDRQVRAWFSSPGIISVDPNAASFTMLQAGTPTPSSQTITVSNIGQRPITLGTTQITYTPSVAPWLNVSINRTVIDTLTPATMTLSIISNNLDPGVYTAAVYVGDFVVTVGQVNVTLTVQLPNPTISNVSGQLQTLNDTLICGYMDPAGSLFRFVMDYTDADGDVNQSTAVLTVAYQFNPGSSGQFQQPPEAGMTVSGDGFSGTITSYICNLFGSATSVTEMFTLQDSQENASNMLSITVPKPSGANAPPAGDAPPPAETAPSMAGGARVEGGSG